MTHEEMIAVLQAHKDGKKIECRTKWEECWKAAPTNPCWNFDLYDYRIKPEPPKPKELWVNEYASGGLAAHSTKKAALRRGNYNAIRTAVLYREVLEGQ
jgi:hypothetical protein